MKIRLIGSEDLVRRCAELLERGGITGKYYPSRYSESEVRWYGDVDDRQVEDLVAGMGGLLVAAEQEHDSPKRCVFARAERRASSKAPLRDGTGSPQIRGRRKVAPP